jgi:hypothetical protein
MRHLRTRARTFIKYIGKCTISAGKTGVSGHFFQKSEELNAKVDGRLFFKIKKE